MSPFLVQFIEDGYSNPNTEIGAHINIQNDCSDASPSSTIFGTTLNYSKDYIIVLRDVEYIYIPLSSASSTCGDFGFDYFCNGGSWSLSEYHNGRGVSFGYGDWTEKINVTINNSFGGGQLKVDNYLFNSGTKLGLEGGSTHTYEALNSQGYGNYYYFFYNWSTTQTTNTVNLQLYNSSNIYANFNQQCKLDLINNFYPEVGNGSLIVESQTRSLPVSDLFYAIGSQPNLLAPDQTINYIDFTFSHWSSNYPFQYNINNNQTVTAYYTAQASVAALNLHFGSNVGQPIQIIWSDNLNTRITQYKIYRRVFSNGSWSSIVLLGTVSKGSGQTIDYVDYDYNLENWQDGTLIEYGLSAYYSGNDSWSQTGWARVYGSIGASMQSNDLAGRIMIEKETPTDYSISNYPNPFNPVTTINYQLPKDGMVTIKVYDVLGKEVATLVNEQKSAGYYKADFDASKLTSGVYICSIQASSFSKSIKLVLAK